jgi:hypothetical protein
MNLLQAYSFLNMVTEGKDSYLDEYKKYVDGHRARVKQFADWLEENLPEVFNDVDLEAFHEVIDEHDESKFSEPEFEAYAQHFYGAKDNDFEYDQAWEHHWQNNEHHPEHWLGEDMPLIYILEMICDWGSFSIAKKDFNELINYYYEQAKDDEEKNLSDNTKKIIEDILDKIKSVIEEED